MNAKQIIIAEVKEHKTNPFHNFGNIHMENGEFFVSASEDPESLFCPAELLRDLYNEHGCKPVKIANIILNA